MLASKAATPHTMTVAFVRDVPLPCPDEEPGILPTTMVVFSTAVGQAISKSYATC